MSACLNCGACCAFFRVSFYWGEAQSGGGVVPDALIHPLPPYHACMQGTQASSPRCHALMGDVGQSVRCTIYENRSSTCREFQSSDETYEGNADCDRARAHYGLPPLPRLPIPETDPPLTEVAG